MPYWLVNILGAEALKGRIAFFLGAMRNPL
jgi:hypothetical protein